MQEIDVLKRVREFWSHESLRLTTEDRKFVEGKYNSKTRMLGMFSPNYYKRKKLVETGEVYYGYVFKMYRRQEDDAEYYPVWVLYSPHHSFQENPEKYRELLPLLEKRYGEKRKFYREKVEMALHERFADASMLEIDESITDNKPVYLSIVYFKREHISELRFGINLFLANQKVSKELLFLPERYWTKEYGGLYKRNFRAEEAESDPTIEKTHEENAKD